MAARTGMQHARGRLLLDLQRERSRRGVVVGSVGVGCKTRHSSGRQLAVTGAHSTGHEVQAAMCIASYLFSLTSPSA